MTAMLSIIIVNHKNPPLLRLCLKSLLRTVSPDIDYEIIVVDSQTSTETQNVVTEEFAPAFKRIKLLPYRENTGYTHGVNEGIRHSSGDHFLILNPDIVVLEGSVESLVRYLSENPSIGLVGPQLLNFDGSRQDSCFRFVTPLTILYRRVLPFSSRLVDRFLMHDVDLTKPTETDWLMGSALMTSRAAVERVGLMDERLFHYFNDVDWPKRFWENGYTVVYYPQARMYHYHQRQSKGPFGIFDALFTQGTRWHIRDALVYFAKYGLTASGKRPEAHQTALIS